MSDTFNYNSGHPFGMGGFFGGGCGGGVKIVPIAFLVVKDGNVRMLPVAAPANTTPDRIVEMVPDVLDKLTAFIDSKLQKPEEKTE
jgi:uncharacterized spore protein YtfJ